MKKFLTLVVAMAMVIPSMAIGRNDGSTKANAIDFDWDNGVEHVSGTKWYRVDLAPLYEEESPSLTLYLTNPSNAVGTSVDVSMQATVAGQSESKDYTIAARQYKTYTANATSLVRMKQTEIYLTLTSTGKIKLSAKVFETADLDETCKDARTLAWGTVTTQAPSYSAWWKVSLKPIKDAADQDAKITITNTGSKTVNLKVGQSLDCPSSGVTKREYTLAAGESVINTIPRSMIASVQPDELYFGIENVESEISIKVEKVAQPLVPVIPTGLSWTDLSVTDTIEPLGAGTHYFRVKVSEMDALNKYEPEFTYRNAGAGNATVSVKMAFELPSYGTSDATYELAPGEEEIVVYKKNMLEGMEGVEYIYLVTEVTGDVNFYGRYKHVREGKACKTNIDYNWETGHIQEARTTQWYAIDLAAAKAGMKDVIVYVENKNASAAAQVKGSVAFSCPYIDLQEITRSVAAGATLNHRLAYSTYAMMADTVWFGIETNQDIRFWADTVDAEKQAVVDSLCLQAVDFNWEEGVLQKADTTVWYRIDMTQVRDLAAKFPTVFVQNLGSAATTITAELSLECPDSIKNEVRTKTIAANESYSKQLSRNLFENIKSDEVFLKVHSTQQISLQIRLTEAAEGTDCSSAIPFNWVSGNTQAANANLWYSVDLRDVMKRGNDLRLHLENKDNAAGKGVIQLSYECPVMAAPSIRNFNLAAHGEKSATIQNSALETLEDSIVYVNVQGTTALRFWADTLPLAPFDTIYGATPLIKLEWDSTYTQTQDTVWYIIPKSEIDKVNNKEDKVKPVAHLWNIGTAENTYKVEAAFAFPIVKNMMTKSQKLAAGKHFSDTIPASTFEQFLKKDSIIIRVTRPVGSGNFQFRAELVKAFSGNTRNDALPIRMNEAYGQSANTEMWYKLNTADLKKDKDLYNKVLRVTGKNAGNGDAKVSVAVYEGLLSETDLIDKFGLSDYRERTIKKGQGKTHNVPAQAVYGLGDVELYIKVRTTDSLYFATKFNGKYAPQAVDPAQAKAKLLVPNVEYVVPGDNQEHWYMVCIPMIQNNYIYTAASTLDYELNGPATIEGTFTFQDEMDCKMPVRKRTINKSGGYHKGSKPLSELVNKAIKRVTNRDFDVSTFQEAFVDSMLHRYITSDSITGYIRIKTDNDLKVKLNIPQITGDQCTNPMAFDWEHGNVNPAGADTWYHVDLDSIIVPDTCDLRLHIDNWSTTADNNLNADLYFDCNDPATKSQSYTLVAEGKDSIDIDRDFLQQLGWADMIINFNSDQVAHIWAELIPNTLRDTLYDTITVYVCQGGSFEDTIRNNYKLIDPVEYSMEWNDTVTFQDGVTMKDSVITFYLHPLVTPEALTVDSMKKLDAAPLLVQGMQLYVDASNAALTEYYRNLGESVDTITRIDTAYWAKPVYKTNGDLNISTQAPLDLTSYYPKGKEQDTLLLVIVSDTCGFIYRQDIVFPVEDYKYTAKGDTLCPADFNALAKNPDTLACAAPVADTLGLPRYIDTIVTYVSRTLPVLYKQSDGAILEPVVTNSLPIDTTGTIAALLTKFATDADELTMAVTGAKWQVNVGGAWLDMPYTVAHDETPVTMRYVITTECGTTMESGNFVYNLVPPCDNDTVYMTTPIEVCGSYTWDKDGQTYSLSGIYYYDAFGEPVGTSCHVVYELYLIVNLPDEVTASPVTACDSYYWAEADTTILTSGTYKHVFTNQLGCDSIVTLTVTINTSVEVTAPAVTECDTYYWAEADTTIITSGSYQHLFLTKAGCDSLVTLDVTINYSNTGDTTAVACDSFTWYDGEHTTSGDYEFKLENAAGCDSVVTLHLTINNSVETTAPAVSECNLYYWAFADSLITTSGTYSHTEATVNGCDSTVTLNVTINTPYVDTLEVRGYYGDRIIMINRNQINEMPGWQLDSIDNGAGYVKWYQMLGATPDPTTDPQVATGYYYTLESGDPIPAGSYYATVEIPASSAASCGAIGTTEVYTIGAAAPAPALIPSLARPGEEIKVINLDPEVETTIRIYTAEGLLQKNFTVSGESSFTIQAAYDNGFYLVELISNNLKSTLRYIVK